MTMVLNSQRKANAVYATWGGGGKKWVAEETWGHKTEVEKVRGGRNKSGSMGGEIKKIFSRWGEGEMSGVWFGGGVSGGFFGTRW